jgi:hypothetical protein
MQTLDDFDKRFPTDNACKQYLKEMRWPAAVTCPRCGNEKVYTLARPFNWVCKSGTQSTNTETGEVVTCDKKNGYRFSVISGTIFENTKRPLKAWFKIGYLMLTAKKGISALQLHRMMYGSKHLNNYHTTWYMCMRLRAAMQDTEWEQLMGEVEVDETYIGGKAHNMHARDRKALALTGTKGKVAVIGAIARKGSVVAKVVENTDTRTLDTFVHEAVSKKVSLLATDEHSGYRFLKRDLPHGVVRHSAGEYVVGAIHTNTIEGFWSLLKRGIVGSFHKVSKDYMPLYLSEFTFRYNRRNDDDPFAELISNA